MIKALNSVFLNVDNRVIMPFKFQIRILVSSGDVIYLWTVPSIETKVDLIKLVLYQDL